MKNLRVLVATLTLAVSFGSWAGDPKPKYGPEAIPLSLSHEYLIKHPASPFWSLIPYYLPQQNGKSCSVASAAMVVNAARVGMKLNANDKLVTHDELLKRVNSSWSWGVGLLGRGVTLDQLGPYLQAGLEAYGIIPEQLEIVHVDPSDLSKKKLRAALKEFENSKRHLIVINFIQGVYTGDAVVGHIAPLAAYDSENHRVLVMDPDREWYEPYWISEDTLLMGMTTFDQGAGKTRGYIRIRLPERR